MWVVRWVVVGSQWWVLPIDSHGLGFAALVAYLLSSYVIHIKSLGTLFFVLFLFFITSYG